MRVLKKKGCIASVSGQLALPKIEKIKYSEAEKLLHKITKEITLTHLHGTGLVLHLNFIQL